MRPSKWEILLAAQIRAANIREPAREYKFHPKRKWRFDFAWPHCRIAVEVEGGIWIRGRHNRGAGYAKDTEKYNAAALMGWRVLRFTSASISKGEALQAIKEAVL